MRYKVIIVVEPISRSVKHVSADDLQTARDNRRFWKLFGCEVKIWDNANRKLVA